jgi:hypothetical protein
VSAQVLDIRVAACEEVVDAKDVSTFGDQPFAKVGAEEARSTRNEDTFLEMHRHPGMNDKSTGR